MPQHQQFKKSIKQAAKSKLRNSAAMSHMKSMIKKLKGTTSKEEAGVLLNKVVSVIDSTARKGMIKKNTAAHKKSKLYKFVSKIA